MKIKTALVLVVLSLAVAVPVFPQEKILTSLWASQPAQIDGQDEEWNPDVLFLEKGSKVKCAFLNDQENLYVLLVFEEPKSLSTIDATGITLSFNTEGKKKKMSGIHFIKKMLTPEEVIAELEKEGQVLTEEQKQSIRSKAGAIVFAAEAVRDKGQPATEKEFIPGASRPVFKTSEGEKRVIYEFRIPLARSEGHPLGIGALPGQTIYINFEWGGMTEQMRKAMQARARGELGGDIGKSSGAGSVIVPGREAGGAPGGGPMPVPKKHSFWVPVKLAAKE